MRFTHFVIRIRSIVAIAGIAALVAGCGGSTEQAVSQQASKPKAKQTAQVAAVPDGDKGIGPVDHLDLGPIDATTVEQGRAIFDSKCAVCHKFEERYVGPALAGVTKRRTPEWIMNMILNPEEMIAKDETARELFVEYLTPMTFQNVSHEDALALLTYFRAVEEGGDQDGAATR